MNQDPENIKADIAVTRAQIEQVVDELGQKVVHTRVAIRQRLSIRGFIHRHRLVLGVGAAVLAGSTWLMFAAIRRTWPVRLYVGVRTMGSFLHRAGR